MFFTASIFSEVKCATTSSSNGATIFGYHVKDPERFGVVEFDSQGKVLSD